MSTYKLFFAGSGGQGILLMGQAVTYAAMYEDLEATFMPSYGPEMRGGTANCTVCVSDKPISCPLIYEADAVVAMNLPSLIKFEPLVRPGGVIFRNTEIIDQSITRTDITQIRPLLYCGEGFVRNLANRLELPVVHNPCPADGYTKRQEVKELVAKLSEDYPRLKDYVFGAMQNLPLPEWKPNASRRRPPADGEEE